MPLITSTPFKLPPPTEFTLSNVTAAGFLPVTGFDSARVGLFLKPDGTKLFVMSTGEDSIFEYNVSTAWDISTATFGSPIPFFDISSEDLFPDNPFFKPDGTKMYFLGRGASDSVHEYDLSVAWDVTSASLLQSKSIAAQDTTAFGVFFKPDGTKMYHTGINSDKFYEYDLSIAWDISTATLFQDRSYLSEDTDVRVITFNPDGTKMFAVGTISNKAHEYNVGTPWDINTISVVQEFSFANEGTVPQGLIFKPDGTRMYTIISSNQRIYQYDLV